MQKSKYTVAEVQQHLGDTKNWVFENDALKRELQFKDFVEAFGFLARLALETEKMDHHAEIHNVYNKVTLRLSTHTAGGVTDKDFTLARRIEHLLS